MLFRQKALQNILELLEKNKLGNLCLLARI